MDGRIELQNKTQEMNGELTLEIDQEKEAEDTIKDELF